MYAYPETTLEVLIWRYLAELKICNTDIPHSPCLCQPDKKILEATFVLPLQALALRPYDLKVSLHHHIHSCICEFFKACQSHLCHKFTYFIELRYESSTLILYKELSSPIFQSL